MEVASLSPHDIITGNSISCLLILDYWWLISTPSYLQIKDGITGQAGFCRFIGLCCCIAMPVTHRRFAIAQLDNLIVFAWQMYSPAVLDDL